jgi:intraflagellar transport protein 140
MKEAKR